jgi:hypothetical protein
MLFGMANALAYFQNIINEIFKDKIDLSIITYINNILKYIQIKAKYEKLVKEVLRYLQK